MKQTITLKIVKGLIAQAKAIGCDTDRGCWVIQKSVIFDDITLSNGTVTFSSRHNKEPKDETNAESCTTSNAMPTLADTVAT